MTCRRCKKPECAFGWKVRTEYSSPSMEVLITMRGIGSSVRLDCQMKIDEESRSGRGCDGEARGGLGISVSQQHLPNLGAIQACACPFYFTCSSFFPVHFLEQSSRCIELRLYFDLCFVSSTILYVASSLSFLLHYPLSHASTRVLELDEALAQQRWQHRHP